MDIDWHRDTLTRATPITAHYKSTQNVRRFMLEQCGPTFKFDRAFMAWLRSGEPNTLGDVADEWCRLNSGSRAVADN
ncbi:DUF6434 domain-containing protein [Pseudomonas rhodesiae]|uniref:DUF6434 domain-containing protein n=1 Tax=Pseudomonas rhodesiae TaxID=76760 RepID=UPI0032B1C432